MTATSVETQEWQRGQRWVFLLIILAGQVGLIFWLAKWRAPGVASLPAFAEIYLTKNPMADWPGLMNPTLFVLANEQGFSGKAWMKVPPQEYDLPTWNEPDHLLAFPTEKLGDDLDEFLKTNQKADFVLSVKPEPELPPVVVIDNSVSAPSTVMVEGDLAAHPLLTQLKLKGWPASDILTNSVVQTVVDSDGKVFSAILFSKSGSRDADNEALALARSARFRPWRDFGSARLHWGQLIFRWQTLAAPATNSLSANP